MTAKKRNSASVSRSRAPPPPPTKTATAALVLLALALLAACVPTARAYTDPEHVKILLKAKECEFRV
jgi:MYXO-CTERM domain-containing protein